MMKSVDPVKIEHQSAEALRRILAEIPAIDRLEVRYAKRNDQIDFIAQVEVFGKRHTLVAEVKSNGQPRHVRA